MKQIVADEKLVSFCGLYCGACSRYLSEKCPGCRDNIKASWCKVRSCGLENGFNSCADCASFSEVNDCKKFNNVFARFFSMVFRSNRAAGIAMIKEKGLGGFSRYMAENKLQSIKR